MISITRRPYYESNKTIRQDRIPDIEQGGKPPSAPRHHDGGGRADPPHNLAKTCTKYAYIVSTYKEKTKEPQHPEKAI